MLLIRCPFCGPRDHTEFTYAGDAALRWPADGPEASLEAWVDYVYLRDNPRGAHTEYWHHTSGCRSYVVVRRDTLFHEIASTALPNGAEVTS